MLIKPGVERMEYTSAEDILLALSPANAHWNAKPSDWLFRGHGDSRWRLVPTALRADPIPRLDLSSKNPVLKTTHAEQVTAEWTLLWEFFRVANQHGMAIPEGSQLYRSPDLFVKFIEPEYKEAIHGDRAWPLERLLSLAALAQHYGVASRLLDWSTRPLVAAYFAAQVPTCTSGQGPVRSISVWCLNWRYVWKVWPADKAAMTKDVEYVLLVTAPRASNPNLHAQGGVFTLDCAASVHPPRFHTVRYGGVLAPHAKWRPLVVPPPPPEAAAAETDAPACHSLPPDKDAPARAATHRCKYIPWRQLMRRGLNLDVETCPRCGGKMKLIALVQDAENIARYLRHLGLPTEVPPMAPARGPPFWQSRVLRRRYGEPADAA